MNSDCEMGVSIAGFSAQTEGLDNGPLPISLAGVSDLASGFSIFGAGGGADLLTLLARHAANFGLTCEVYRPARPFGNAITTPMNNAPMNTSHSVGKLSEK